MLEVSSNRVDWTAIAEDAGQNPILRLRLTNDPAPALRFFRLAPAARGAGK